MRSVTSACHKGAGGRHFNLVDAVLLRASARDAAAFEALYRLHAPRLHRLVLRQVPEHVALDLVAETFAQAIVSAHRFRGQSDGEAVAWLNGIAQNLVRGYYRRARVETKARRALEIEQHVRAAIAAAENDLTLSGDLEAAMAALSTTERRAVELRVVEELPYEEVAAALMIRPDAARTRVSRGLRALALRLGGEAA
jgi:RNA polymerase sigma factor (sigma-70 family)